LAAYRQTVLTATEEIESAFSWLFELEAQNRELGLEINALSRARDSAQAAYLGGAIDLTDVLQVDRQLRHLWCATPQICHAEAGGASSSVDADNEYASWANRRRLWDG